MIKNKNSDYQSLPSFAKKCKRAFKGSCKTYRCYNYYMRHTGDVYYTIKMVFKYIDDFYSKLEYNKDMSCKHRAKEMSKLTKRYDNLNYKSKISFSIISSVVISVFITLMFSLLQTPDENGSTYFTLIKQMENVDYSSVVKSFDGIFAILLLKILVFMTWFSIFISFSCFAIFAIKQIYLLNSQMRLIVIPYERNAIIKTISTYNSKLETILRQ